MSELSVPMKINGRNKDEIYIFSERLYQEFISVSENKHILPINSNIDKYLEQLIRDQYIYFIKHLNVLDANSTLVNIPPTCTEHYKDVVIEYLKINAKKYILELEIHENTRKRYFELTKLEKPGGIELVKLEKTQEFELIKLEKSGGLELIKLEKQGEIELAKLEKQKEIESLKLQKMKLMKNLSEDF